MKNVTFAATGLLLATVLAFAVFGALLFAVSESHVHCVAATEQGMPCPSNGIASVLFHSAFLKTFTDAILPSAAAALSLAVLALSFVLFARYRMPTRGAPDAHALARAGGVPVLIIPVASQLVNWLSLHTNSPGAV